LDLEPILSDAAWEAIYAAYDPATYQAVLDRLGPNDIVLDIGAGDLRLARQMARIACKVYAVEINPRVLELAHLASGPLPENLTPICGDARTLEFPSDITTGVLLMRHCTCFRLYATKLIGLGAKRLITNARWRMGVEVVDLCEQRPSFVEAGMGWYACLCGSVGFKAGPAENWTIEMDRDVQELSCCPQCFENIMSFS
jgi:SAM-dependent methyltransferase